MHYFITHTIFIILVRKERSFIADISTVFILFLLQTLSGYLNTVLQLLIFDALVIVTYTVYIQTIFLTLFFFSERDFLLDERAGLGLLEIE